MVALPRGVLFHDPILIRRFTYLLYHYVTRNNSDAPVHTHIVSKVFLFLRGGASSTNLEFRLVLATLIKRFYYYLYNRSEPIIKTHFQSNFLEKLKWPAFLFTPTDSLMFSYDSPVILIVRPINFLRGPKELVEFKWKMTMWQKEYDITNKINRVYIS